MAVSTKTLVTATMTVLVALLVAWFSWTSTSAAQDGCTRTISPNDDMQDALYALKPGDVLCLRDGTYAEPNDSIFDVNVAGTADKRITIRNYPGETATLDGDLYFYYDGDYVTVSGLNLTTHNKGTVVIYGDYVTLQGNYITNPDDICIFGGQATDSGIDKISYGLVIDNNYIHDCGGASNNHKHGVYLTATRGAKVTNNRIENNPDRGIQLYRDADGTLVKNNTITNNGEGVNIGGTTFSTSSDNTIENNYITNSKVRWNVEEYWPGSVGTNNKVRYNCLYASNADGYYNQNGGVQTPHEGFSAYVNFVFEGCSAGG